MRSGVDGVEGDATRSVRAGYGDDAALEMA
jgi:hypothetical protein